MLTPSQTLMRVVKSHKALSMTGKYHRVLQSLAQRHARGLATRNTWVAPHAGWGERQIELVSRAPEAKNFGEVCAWAIAHGAQAAAEAVFAEWKNSPVHWQMVNGYYDYWGYAMYQSRTGVWYATGIVGQKR